MERHEIAAYGSQVAAANHVGLRQAATLLGRTLNEEKAAAAKLTASWPDVGKSAGSAGTEGRVEPV